MSDDLQQMLSETELHIGDVVTGTVTAIDDKKVTLNIGGPFEAIIPIRELSPLHIDHPNQVAQVGDAIRAEIVKLDEEGGTVVLSKRAVDAGAAWDELRRKFDNQEVLEVVINDVVKGGLVTDVGVRGFIPASLVDTQFIKNLDQFKGQTVRVVVHEIDPENNKLILSRKSVVEQEQRNQLRDLVDNIREGDVIEGTVRRLASFGAFVEVSPGVDGLVHISELAWHRVDTPGEVVHIGDHVRVMVLRVDPDAGKISLSVKQAQKSPWEESVENLREGDIVDGTVRRVVDYGAFVEVAPGVEGLVHVSQIANHHVEKASDELAPSQAVKARILGIDYDRQRISLSLRDAAPRPSGGGSSSRGGGRRQEPNYDYQDDGKGTGATFGDLFGDLFRR